MDPTLAVLRAVVEDLGASTHTIGGPMLEVAPAYLSDTADTDVLTGFTGFTGFTATPARKLTPGEKDANRVLPIGRAPVERGFAHLKNWRASSPSSAPIPPAPLSPCALCLS